MTPTHAPAIAATLAVVATLSASPVARQQPVFDAATIKPNRSGADGSSIGQRPGGQYVMTNGPIGMLLQNAFAPQNRELVGAPDWVGSERYDLQATANATTSSDDLRLMLRALLVERLKLVAHLEPREQPVFFLVKARPDGRLGPKIERATRDCAAMAAARNAGVVPPALAAPANGAPPCGLQTNDAEMLGGGMTMDLLARNLGRAAGRPVFDRTAIDGYFDFTLTYSRGTDNPDAPSFFTALQEQLGLKLEPGRAPLQTLVIEHIERPSEN
jgi:uncharacterized protein (TIGR03435 family)